MKEVAKKVVVRGTVGKRTGSLRREIRKAGFNELSVASRIFKDGHKEIYVVKKLNDRPFSKTGLVLEGDQTGRRYVEVIADLKKFLVQVNK